MKKSGDAGTFKHYQSARWALARRFLKNRWFLGAKNAIAFFRWCSFSKGAFEPRSKAGFREGFVIAEAQPSSAGGPNSSRYTTSPQKEENGCCFIKVFV